MKFKEWLESVGCQVEVIQEDDGSGYEVLDVTVPNDEHFIATVDS
jgi:hypothetical protein